MRAHARNPRALPRCPDDNTSGDRHALTFAETTDRRLKATMGEVIRILASLPRLRKQRAPLRFEPGGGDPERRAGAYRRARSQEPRDRRV